MKELLSLPRPIGVPLPPAGPERATVETPGHAGSPRFAGLDGLRAIAVVAVILFHFSPAALPGGFIGVDLFFVISGFLITSLLVREHAASGRIRLGAFWVRRARRLLPALGLVLVVCCAAALVIGGNARIDLVEQVIGATTFSSNWVAIAQGSSYVDELAPDLFRNLWSLAVEEQFYLLWPVAVIALVALPKRVWGVGAVSILATASAVAMAALSIPGADATRVYYGTDTHAFGLAVGAAFALARSGARPLPRVIERRVLPIVGTIAFAAFCGLAAWMGVTDSFTYRGGLVLVAGMSVITIAGAISQESPLGGLLELRPLRWIGERSYGLYLWHWPVLVLVVDAIPGWDRSGSGGWVIGLAAASFTVLAAWASHRWVEMPVRRLGFRGAIARSFTGSHRTPSRIIAAATAFSMVAACGALTAAALTIDPGQSDAQERIEAGQEAIDDVASTPPAPTPDAQPTAKPLPTGDQIVAIGDSVMLAAAPQLQAAFPGIAIDAAVSRQMRQAPEIAQGLLAAGAMRPIVIIGLGTNGPVDRETLEQLYDIVGPDRQLVFVSAQAPRGWIDGVNADLGWIAQRYRDIELADWHDAIAPRLDVLARDQVHPGPTGGQIYSTSVGEALQGLADLPPRRDHADSQLMRPPV